MSLQKSCWRHGKTGWLAIPSLFSTLLARVKYATPVFTCRRARYWSFCAVRTTSRSDARCATPYICSGEVQIRPEVAAARAALRDRRCPAIPSGKSDATWELWTVEGDAE